MGASLGLIAFSRLRSKVSPTKNMRQPKYRSLITGILAIHTLYMMYTLYFGKPPNLFTWLNIPLTMSSKKIRAVLLARSGMGEGDALPEDMEELLTRLNTFDLRGYFVRFVPALGQHASSTRPHAIEPDSVRTQSKSVSGARPSQTTWRTPFPSSCCLTSRRPHSSEW